VQNYIVDKRSSIFFTIILIYVIILEFWYVRISRIFVRGIYYYIFSCVKFWQYRFNARLWIIFESQHSYFIHAIWLRCWYIFLNIIIWLFEAYCRCRINLKWNYLIHLIPLIKNSIRFIIEISRFNSSIYIFILK